MTALEKSKTYECAMCHGTGKFRMYDGKRGYALNPRAKQTGDFYLIECPWCAGSGETERQLDPMTELMKLQDRDPVRRSHEDGDADGLGGCRGITVSMVMIALVCAVVWALTATGHPLFSG